MGIIDGVVDIIRSSQASRELTRIQQNNIDSQGITHYLPSDIEAFFDVNEPLYNMSFSGSNAIIRNRAITSVYEVSKAKGYGFVLLHCENTDLEKYLGSLYFSDRLLFVNDNNPIYDPFWNKKPSEISRMVYGSRTNSFRLRADSRYYVEGMYEYLASRNVPQCLFMYTSCPHRELMNKIKDAEKANAISQEKASSIISLLIQGKAQLPDLENFFSELNQQGRRIFASQSSINKRRITNVADAITTDKALIIDIMMASNDVLLNIILSEIEQLLTTGKRVVLVLDGISPISSDLTKKFANRIDRNLSIVLAGDDVFSAFSGEERLFFSFMGKCSKIVLLNHSSAYSCEKWSEYLGTYEKQEITNSYSSHSGGFSQSANVRPKRERIIKPEQIQGMGIMDVIIKNNYSGELAMTTAR